MGARWAGVDENIGAKMCWKIVDDVSGEIICRSTIRSAIELVTANLKVDPIEPRLEEILDTTEDNGLLSKFVSLANI